MAWSPKTNRPTAKPAKPTKPSELSKPSKSTKDPTAVSGRGRGYGATQLARETGFSQVYVSTLFKKGLTVAQIKQRAADRNASGKVHKGGPVIGSKKAVGADGMAKPRHTERTAGPGPRRSVSNETYAQAELRKIIAIADQREMEIAVRRGELLNAGQLLNWFAGGIIAAKDIALKVEELGDRIASETDPAKCRAMIRLEMERMLVELEQAFRMAAETSVEPELRKAGGTDVGSSEDGSGDGEENEAA